MLKSFKYRIYPNIDQKLKIDHSINVCRLVYNLGLQAKIYAWESFKKNLTAIDLCYQLVELKNEYQWISEVDSQALQASLKRLDNAFKNFFRGQGYPRYKGRRKGTQSFQCPNNKRQVNWNKSTLTIPKISEIPIRLSRKFEGIIKTITISKTATNKYYASILVDTKLDPLAKSPMNENNSIGIDVGIKSFVVTSDGRQFEPNRKLKENLKRLQCLQHRASRKQKRSNNRKKANLRAARLYEKITNQRTDYIQQVTTRLIHDNQVGSIVIEDLNVAGMLKNTKLSQAISDVSFAKFFEILKYKCEWYGKNLIIIDRFSPSSKRCSCCGAINDGLTLADRAWTCNCGVLHDRDLNAAKNIRWFGLQQILNNSGVGSSGEPVESRRLRRAKKQE